MQIETKPHIGRKIVATLIDYGLTFILLTIYLRQFGEYDPTENNYSVQGFMTLPIIAYWFLYHVLPEYFWGSTFGHFMLDLKITNIEGEKTKFSQNLKRHLIDPFDIFMWGIPAIIAIKNTEKNQRLGDLWAKTIVTSPKDFELSKMAEEL